MKHPAAALATLAAEIDLALLILQGARNEIAVRLDRATWRDVADFAHLVDGLKRADLQPQPPESERP